MTVEPVAANMGVVPPAPGFLEGLRELCDAHGALLLFDEVITGFRIAYGGAQTFFGVTPDLTAFGKVMGGGFPCAAFGGRRDLMEQLAPIGPVYQAGTLSGNPVAVAAGIAALDLARDDRPVPTPRGAPPTTLIDGLTDGVRRGGDPRDDQPGRLALQRVLHRARSRHAVADFAGAAAADHGRYARFFHHMLAGGVWLPPSGYELWTLSTTHGPDEVGRVVEAVASFRE